MAVERDGWRSCLVILVSMVVLWTTQQCHASTHWIVTEDGRIEQQVNSMFNLKKPFDLVAFMRQEQVLRKVTTQQLEKKKENKTMKIVVRKERINLSQTFFKTDPVCREAKKRLSEFQLELHNIVSFSSKGINIANHLDLVSVPTQSHKRPICDGHLSVTLLTYDHLDGVGGRGGLRGTSEPGLLSAMPYISDVDDWGSRVKSSLDKRRFAMQEEPALEGFGVVVYLDKVQDLESDVTDMMADSKFLTPAQNISWIVLNMAALYWRIKGNSLQAVECLRRALYYSPREHRDVALMSLAVLLHRANHTLDAIVLLHTSLEITKDLVMHHFVLGVMYTTLHVYHMTEVCFKYVTAADPSFSLSVELLKAVRCERRYHEAVDEQRRSHLKTLKKEDNFHDEKDKMYREKQDILYKQQFPFEQFKSQLDQIKPVRGTGQNRVHMSQEQLPVVQFSDNDMKSLQRELVKAMDNKPVNNPRFTVNIKLDNSAPGKHKNFVCQKTKVEHNNDKSTDKRKARKDDNKKGKKKTKSRKTKKKLTSKTSTSSSQANGGGQEKKTGKTATKNTPSSKKTKIEAKVKLSKGKTAVKKQSSDTKVRRVGDTSRKNAKHNSDNTVRLTSSDVVPSNPENRDWKEKKVHSVRSDTRASSDRGLNDDKKLNAELSPEERTRVQLQHARATLARVKKVVQGKRNLLGESNDPAGTPSRGLARKRPKGEGGKDGLTTTKKVVEEVAKEIKRVVGNSAGGGRKGESGRFVRQRHNVDQVPTQFNSRSLRNADGLFKTETNHMQMKNVGPKHAQPVVAKGAKMAGSKRLACEDPSGKKRKKRRKGDDSYRDCFVKGEFNTMEKSLIDKNGEADSAVNVVKTLHFGKGVKQTLESKDLRPNAPHSDQTKKAISEVSEGKTRGLKAEQNIPENNSTSNSTAANENTQKKSKEKATKKNKASQTEKSVRNSVKNRKDSNSEQRTPESRVSPQENKTARRERSATASVLPEFQALRTVLSAAGRSSSTDFKANECTDVKGLDTLLARNDKFSAWLNLESKSVDVTSHVNFIEEIDGLPKPPRCHAKMLTGPQTFDHLEGVLDVGKQKLLPEIGLTQSLLVLNRFAHMSVEEIGTRIHKALKKEPTSWVLLNVASLYWRVVGDTTEAVRCLRLAISHSPVKSRDVALFSLASILLRGGYLTSAATVCTEALKISPNALIGHFTLANILASQTKITKATQHYLIVLQLEAGFRPAIERLKVIQCILWRQQQELEREAEELRKLLTIA